MDFSADATDFTVSAWINTQFTTTHNYIAGTGLHQGLYFRVDSSNLLLIKIDDGTDDEFATGSTVLNDGAWHHVVMTLNNTNNTFLGYVDGTEEITLTTGSVNNLGDDFEIGRVFNESGGALYYTGTLDEVRVTNSELSADWIKTEYRNQNSPSSFYAYGGQEAETRQDASGNEVPAVKVRGGVKFRFLDILNKVMSQQHKVDKQEFNYAQYDNAVKFYEGQFGLKVADKHPVNFQIVIDVKDKYLKRAYYTKKRIGKNESGEVFYVSTKFSLSFYKRGVPLNKSMDTSERRLFNRKEILKNPRVKILLC
jgi:hypothetical protein